MNKKKITVLILGASGMVGRTLYHYLSENNDFNVIGTSRNPYGKFIKFDAHDSVQLEKLIKRHSVDYIINCIGILSNFESREELVYINSFFPQLLEKITQKRSCKLIHISTDAVFSHQQKNAHEKSIPCPNDLYGASKWLGETTNNSSMTIRTSFLGLDPNRRHGLLEWVKAQRKVKGFTNQQWTGCTTLQFAYLCEYIIEKKKFNKLRSTSNIFHFVPLGPASKYVILKSFIQEVGLKISLSKSSDKTIKRTLTTIYFDILKLNSYTNNISKALQELLVFEDSIKNTP